jgi:sRNA-binding protein
MPKSRQRKNHKKKVESYKKSLQEKRNAYKNEYIRMMQEKQQEDLQNKLKEQTTNMDIVDTSDIDIGDINDKEIDKEEQKKLITEIMNDDEKLNI